MLEVAEKAFIHDRVQWLLAQRYQRATHIEKGNYFRDGHEYDQSGKLISIANDISPEIQVSWSAWQIKQDFQKTTLRDVFMQAIAEEFNRYLGIQASFVPNQFDDNRVVLITTCPIAVDAPAVVSWPTRY